MPELPKLRIESEDARGRNARVYINDEDWSYALTGLQLKMGVDDMSTVVLEMMLGEVSVDAEAGVAIVARVLDESGIKVEWEGPADE